MYELLITTLGKPIGKLLLQKFLGVTGLSGEAGALATGVGEELIGIAATRITALADQRKAARTFEQLADLVVTQLVPVFERESRQGEFNVEKVVFQLQQTLGHDTSVKFLIEHGLDPDRLTNAWNQARPIPQEELDPLDEELYGRALRLCARYVSEVAEHLPTFHSTAYAAQFKQINALDDRLVEILTNLGEILTNVGRIAETVDPQDRLARFQADYLRAVESKVNYLELFGVDLDPVSSRYKLSVAYVSLNLENNAASKTQKNTFREQEESTGSPIAAESLLDQLMPKNGRILVEGPAGSGKSTLLRWAAWTAAKQEPHILRSSNCLGVEQAEFSWRQCIPFLIRLRDCKGGKLPGIDQFPLLITDKLGNPPQGWANNILSSGRALIMIDGIDEVPDQDRPSIYLEVKELCETYPDCYYLLSTRPLRKDDRENWQVLLDFRRARINPLSHTDRDMLIDRWHEAVAEGLRSLKNPLADEMPNLADALKFELHEVPPIAQLASTPLLAAVICAIHRYRNKNLPKTQAELCEALCQMLLERREIESKLDLSGFSKPYRSLNYRQRKEVITEIAQWMVLNGHSAIEEKQALRHISQVLSLFHDRSGEEAPEVLKALIERSGMLRETQTGGIEFIHNTLKEYLAGGYFAGKFYYDELAARATDTEWQQTVIFAAALGDKDFANELIQAVLEMSKPSLQTTQEAPKPPVRSWRRGNRNRTLDKNTIRKWNLMAVRIEAAASSLEAPLRDEVAKIRRSLFPPRTIDEAESLAFAAGDVIVPFLRYHDKLSEQEAIASIRALRIINSRGSRAFLNEYAQIKHISVAEELACAIDPLKIDCIRKKLFRGENIPLSIREKISDLSALSDLPNTPKPRSLDLSFARKLRDITPLAQIHSLQSLHLSFTQVADIRPLAQLHSLQFLSLSNTQVTDVRPLSQLYSLQSLVLSNTQVTDVSSLAHLPKLQIKR